MTGSTNCLLKSGEKDILKTNDGDLAAAVTGLPPEDLVEFFKKEDGFFIVIHLNPDGDALGSACALGMALEKLGKRIILVCRDKVPDQYTFLPGIGLFQTFDTISSGDLDFELYPNLVLVDCNDIKRTGLEKSRVAFTKFAASAVIDHHETERPSDNLQWIVPGMAAAGMLVYYLVRALQVTITGPMATNLYAALIVDTGNFRYPNTSAEVLHAAADLAAKGANPSLINRSINESWSANRFRLFVKVLGTLSIDSGIAIIHVTRKMFEETATTPDDTENFASFALIMKDIKIAVFVREMGDYNYKISLRSAEGIDVQKVAAMYGGGGHKNAAGCVAQGQLGLVKAELIKKLRSIALTISRTTLRV